jgi:hypothetical protein
MPKRKRQSQKRGQADVAADAIRSALITTSSIATGEDLVGAVLGALDSMISKQRAVTLISGAVRVGIIKRVATDPSDIIPKGGRFSCIFSYSLTGSSATDVAEKVELVRLEKQQKNAEYMASEHGKQVRAEYAHEYEDSEHGKQVRAVLRAEYEDSEHGKQVRAEYEDSEHGEQVRAEYTASEHGKQVRAEYEDEHGKQVRAEYEDSERGKQVRAECKARQGQKRRLENGARSHAHARHHALSIIQMIETGLFERTPEGTPQAPDSYSPAVMALF